MNYKSDKVALIFSFIFLAFFPHELLAHAEEGVAGGFVSGFLHPVYGFDHLIAMVAVGLWGAQLREPAIWTLPVAFPMVMALGGLLGLLGIPLPFIEIGIALSALFLGLSIALHFLPSLWLAISVVSFFAVFHGYAHGAGVPTSANPLAYGIGFVLCTGLLHLAGILLGLLIRWPLGNQFIRALGGVIGALGLYFLASQITN